MMRNLRTWALVPFMAVVAIGQPYFTESFDFFAPGALCSQAGCPNAGFSNGWEAWDLATAFAGEVSLAQARSGPFSLRVSNNIDAIQPFALNDPTGYPTSGVWVLSLWQYIEGATFTPGSGSQYIVGNNEYNYGGPYSWVIQMQFNPTTGLVEEDISSAAFLNARAVGSGSGTARIQVDTWMEIRIEMDLDNNCIRQYYGGQLLCEGSFVNTQTANQTVFAFANLDLYAPAGTSVAYYDDITLQRAGGSVGSGWAANTLEAQLDINGVTAQGCASAVSQRAGGSPSILFANSSNSGVGAVFDIFVQPGTPIDANLSGLVLAGRQYVNVNPFATGGFFLNTFGPSFSLLPMPAAGLTLNFVTPPAPVALSSQMVLVDPLFASGFRTSQAATIEGL